MPTKVRCFHSIYCCNINKGWGILIPSRIAWILMEIPNVIVLLIVIFFYADTPSTKSLSNRVLLACFGGHYINRTFIYPFRTKNGAPMPISIMIVAMFYVTWNSLQQSMALCVVFVYRYIIQRIRHACIIYST